jgi:hypothetical protein
VGRRLGGPGVRRWNVQFRQDGGAGNTISDTIVGGDVECDHNAALSGTGTTVGGNGKQCAGL